MGFGAGAREDEQAAANATTRGRRSPAIAGLEMRMVRYLAGPIDLPAAPL
jgi:hypothetical protein